MGPVDGGCSRATGHSKTSADAGPIRGAGTMVRDCGWAPRVSRSARAGRVRRDGGAFYSPAGYARHCGIRLAADAFGTCGGVAGSEGRLAGDYEGAGEIFDVAGR